MYKATDDKPCEKLNCRGAGLLQPRKLASLSVILMAEYRNIVGGGR